MSRKSLIVVVVAWVVSLVGVGAWVTAQELPQTQVIYLGDQNLIVVVGDKPDKTGAIEGRLLVKRDGKFVPVVLKAQ
jgi:hypothetical protein